MYEIFSRYTKKLSIIRRKNRGRKDIEMCIEKVLRKTLPTIYSILKKVSIYRASLRFSTVPQLSLFRLFSVDSGEG